MNAQLELVKEKAVDYYDSRHTFVYLLTAHALTCGNLGHFPPHAAAGQPVETWVGLHNLSK